MKKIILPVYIIIVLLLTGNRAGAQCDQIGQIVQPSNSSTCGKLILSYDTWNLLVPTNADMLIGVEVNEEIQFSYTIDPQQTLCIAGPAVILDCVTPLSTPPQNCDASFSYSANFDEPTPVVSFQPTTINGTAEYHWDFGDGNSSDYHTITHTFPAQDFYEVCLTVKGGSCSSEVVACQTVDLHECHASFYSASDNGIVEFINTSTGSYSDWEWSMGDGQEIQNTDVDTYDYGEINIYTVCLTVWNDNGCTSKFCNYVYSGSGDICEFAACVYPGDTNADGAANVYDLLPIGVGYGTEGPPRQLDDVSFALDWSAQYAPDWGQETINGNDYKHLDCDGNGEVDGDDAMAIEANYAEPGNMFMVQASGMPTFWLDFEWDTILIDDNTPALIQLEANLMAGLPSLPMQNLNGFALQLDYPEDMVVLDGVTVDYNDNSFFGTSNSIIWLHKDRYFNGELDLGFTRKHNQKNGFGKIATLNFIVISDLVARDAEATFTVEIKDVVAVNQEGAMLAIGDLEPASVHVIDKTTTFTEEDWLDKQVLIFPNPTSDNIRIQHLNNLQIESATVFNSIGQLIVDMPIHSNDFNLSVAEWGTGIYLIKVKTDQGVAIKRVVVKE